MWQHCYITRTRLCNQIGSELCATPDPNLSEMALNGGAPPRGSAAASAANLRRRRTSSAGGASAGGTSGNMLQFYTDDAPGLKISPNVVLVMSIGFIAFVAVLHVMGKLYLNRREA
ncbi:Protein transport protein Sec61 subunit beta [Heracleum sosnowskyi]|uniref:Protein transport protein Sec61 subunit beta n=1 Tax=Heracleum sosnowskyi TaxID=360622 RepID=A0AAD8ITU2_9APIA|nr:Protein transport protein Sec61 subunit beta [Heracleum sosnowskyi]